jgi:netrin-G3 ligand
LESLYPNSLYHVWVAAKSKRGEGATTPSLSARTEQYLPGEPTNLQAKVINSSIVGVTWDPPVDKAQNGIIRGYQIHVQPKNVESAYYVPLTFNTGSGEVTAYNVSGLSPDTRYTIQVAALTRRGDGTRSQPVKIKTPGGVPSRPNITPRLINPIENSITMDIEWTKPVETYGDLTGYLVKYGKRDLKHTEILITDKDVQHQQISNLEIFLILLQK